MICSKSWYYELKVEQFSFSLYNNNSWSQKIEEVKLDETNGQ